MKKNHNYYGLFKPNSNWHKLLLTMKISAFLLFCCFVNIFAAPTYSQSTKISLNIKDVTIEEVLNKIEDVSEFYFLYNTKLIDVERKVNIDAKKESIKDILSNIFDEKVKIIVYDRQIILSPNVISEVLSATQQKNKISGTVIDKNGNPQIGVNVVVTGTTLGATTDITGRYSIEVPEGAKSLTFSFIGMVPQEISIGTLTQIDVTMAESAVGLEEVVVIGYGTMKKANVTGAISQMGNAQTLEERPVSRVDRAMVGQISGVRVKQTTGVLGKGISVEIRGSGSLSGNNQPLYVIDGFPQTMGNQDSNGTFSNNPLDNISPGDIQSIEVLKDASAAAIYGSRAANGVVMITTKSGLKGKVKIDFNVKAGVSNITKKYDILNTAEWVERATEMINAKYLSLGPGRSVSDNSATRQAIIGNFDNSQILDERWAQPNYGGLMPVDWQDAIFKQGYVKEYTLSASGGTDFVKYYISTNYMNQDGTSVGMNYKLYSARINIEVNASKKLSFGLNINPSYSIRNDADIEGKDKPLFWAISMNPIVEADQGLYVNSFDKGVYIWSKQNENSPLARLQNTKNEFRVFRTLISTYAQYEIIPGLALKSTLNLDNDDSQNEYFMPSTVSATLASRINTPGLFAAGSFSGYRSPNFLNENTLTYHTVLAAKHNISLLAGTSFNSITRLNWSISSYGGYANDFVYTLNNANGIAATSQTNRTANAMVSMFGRAQYSYNEKYLFSASVRRDGSSRFGSNTKWGVFPAASIGWRITQENFMPKMDMLNELKLRASWGVSGNDNFGDYEQYARLGLDNYSFGNAKVTGTVPVNIAAPDLSWEESTTFDIGADIGLLKSRIQVVADYYNKTSDNLLLNIPVPRVTGFSSASTNIGKVDNKGWEFEVAAKILTGDLKWNASVNLSHNQNKVVKLGPNNAPIVNVASGSVPYSILAVGYPMYEMYLIKQIGILSAEDMANHAPITQGETEGDPKYYDANANGIIDINDRMYIGDPSPKIIWGFNTDLNYKGFDLSATIQGQHGGLLYSNLGRGIDGPAWQFFYNQIGHNRDRWMSAEDPGAGIRGKAYSTMQRTPAGNTDWLYSSDYWRISNIIFGYDLGRLIHTKTIQGARIYISLENYFSGDKYEGGVNPDAVNIGPASGGLGSSSGSDYGAYPLTKSVVFGLNFTF